MKFNQTFAILFWLVRRKENKLGKAPIYIRVTIDGQRTELTTRRLIEPRFWDNYTERVTPDCPDASILNDYLSQVRSEISKHYNMLLATNDQVTVHMIRDSYMNKKPKALEKKTFVQYLDEYIIQREEKVKVGDLSKGRYKKIKVLRGKVLDYMNYKFKKTDLLPAEMKLNFILGFEHCLKTVQDIGHNTASKYAKDLKQVMGYVIIEEDIPNNAFQPFKASYKKVKPKFLTAEELSIIENKVIDIARLDEVRDCFIFSCYTGYSFSDTEALTKNDIVKGIDDSLWIMRERGKTGVAENVPILPKAMEIIEKYKNHPYCKVFNKILPVNSNVRYNAYLKEIANMCGIEKKLTTHVARHTCATTVLLSNGVPIETAQEFLGHSDIRTTQIYARVVQKKLSADMTQLKERLQSKNSVQKQ